MKEPPPLKPLEKINQRKKTNDDGHDGRASPLPVETVPFIGNYYKAAEDGRLFSY
ncbi:hypothetical protein OAG73_00530 [bacterium]|nr:hypothetical protein [bacterium]